MMRTKWFVLALALLMAGAAQANLVINEIMQNPSAVSDSDGEYFEIYNDSDSEVNLNAYTVSDGGSDSFTITSDLFIGAYGYLVFGVNADFATNGGVNVDYEYTGMSLANGDDEVILMDNNGGIVDEVWYDGGTAFPDPNGASMQLLDPGLDNNDGANWAEADLAWGDGTDFGTPGAENEWDTGGGDDTVDVSIMELQTNTDAYLDMVVRVSGIVTIPTATVHAGYSDVYIQDDSGYGINLYDGSIDATMGMDRGDEYEVVGTLIQYFDTTEITEFSITELSTGNALPDPITFTSTGDFAGTAVPWEGTWAMLEGEIQADFDPYDGSYNFSINSGDGDATVRIWGDTNIDLMDGYAIGDNIIVYGAVDVYSGNPQMMPAMLDDIEMADTDPVTLDLTGTDTDVPVEGGNVYYDLHLVSNLPNPVAGVAYRTYATLPNGNFFGPIDTIPFTLMPGMDIMQTGLSLNVPGFAPAGTYTFHGRVGFVSLFVEDTFEFMKSDVAAGTQGVDAWGHSDVNLSGEEASAVEALPADFELSSAYPNPFNPTTSVAVSLPASSELSVTVFNVMGQQVAELANGQFQGGVHNFTFDASSLSSGLYFIQAQVPGELNAIQKVTLMK